MPRRHPPEFRRRAIELAREEAKPIAQVASDIGISKSCLRNWLAQADIDEGRSEGLSTQERAELVQLRRENRVLKMEKEILGSCGLLRQREQLPLSLNFAFIEAEKANHPIVVLYQNLGVSTSGYYRWRDRLERPARRTMFDEFLIELIRQIHAQSRGTYGSPRVHAELVLGEGIHVRKKRVERLMRLAGIEGVFRRKRHFTTRRHPKAAFSDDLVNRQFTVERPDALWVGDVTEHPTAAGKVYLASVIDAFSRGVVGSSIADHLRAELVVDALQMAIWRRHGREAGTIMHTDHGSQCTSWAFGRSLQAAGILGSMGSIGDAFDNAMAESFFGTLQLELLDRQPWEAGRDLPSAIVEYIEAFHNPRRRHSSIGNLSPVEFEDRHAGATVAA